MQESDSYSEYDDSEEDRNYSPIEESSSDSNHDLQNIADVHLNKSLKKKGKNRLRYSDLDKRQVRKRKRNAGEEYVGYKNKLVKARSLQNYIHTCRFQCQKFTDEERQEIFNQFWGLGNWNLQNAFITSCTEIALPKRRRTEAVTNKGKSVTIKLKNMRVCKMFFLKTLDISNGRYSRILNGISDVGITAVDKRGRAPCPNKLSQDVIDKVKRHIDMFPKYISHYTRHYNPRRRYLPSFLTIRKMYKCYLEHCQENNEAPVKEWFYRRVFNTEFNLSFHHPLSDTCNKCDKFETSIKSCTSESDKKKIMCERELHHRKAESGIQAKKEAKIVAETSRNEEVVSVCFDLQKTLPTPALTTNKVFYMRVLWTYNFGVHNLGKKCASMYMWDESVASRGSMEVSLCLWKFIAGLNQNTRHHIAFSDSCSGQNKNKNIVKFFMYVVKETQLEIIDHKFLEPGHTFMECDEDFGVIEKYKKQVPYIFVPSEWMNAVRNSSKKFKCEEMKMEHFISLENFNEYVQENIKKDDENNQIKWREIKWIRFEKKDPFTMKFKYTLNEETEFITVNCMKKMRGRPPQNISLSQLNSSPMSLKYEKWKNLQDLLCFVPPIYHQFYNQLNHTAKKGKQGQKKKPMQPEERKEKDNEDDDEVDDNDKILLSDYDDEEDI
ncbi:uncharacterized protein [Diabrotica undecimpunctata]|uniref:uncharacterized protein n=1 Tax=Diabrotica undecimpunctata TaxID=50387 RepID=UPI003B6410FE